MTVVMEMSFQHDCSSTKDFLSYLLVIHETGQIMLRHGDVIASKSADLLFVTGIRKQDMLIEVCRFGIPLLNISFLK